MEKIINLSRCLLSIADKISPLPVLGLRLWIANIFWKSGLTKLDDWETTVFLFKEEYAVPLLPPELAAYMGTAGELVGPVLLAFGLAGRVGATILLFMTAVIEFTYIHHEQHIIWALVLLLLVSHGPGKISIDYFIRKRFLPN